MNILDTLQQFAGGSIGSQLMQEAGIQDPQSGSQLSNDIITAMIGGLTKNASSQEGLQSLNDALDRDHDGGLLENITSLFSNQVAPQQVKASNGAGILNHVFGDNLTGVVNMLSQQHGVGSEATLSMMVKLAPMLMGFLGKTKKEQGLDAGGLFDLLNQNHKQVAQQNNPILNMVSSFIDKDKDGSIVDDLGNMGMNLLNNLFKKK